MTFHARSIVEFGHFLNRVSDSLMSGRPLRNSLELVREQFDAYAAVLVIEDRVRTGETYHVFTEIDENMTDTAGVALPRAAQLTYLTERCQPMSATLLAADDSARYTLWVFRDRAGPKFDDQAASVCEILVSQLSRGVEMSWRMGATEVERSLYSDVMDKLYVGVVILDHSGKIIRASDAATRFLEARDGLQIQGNRLRATSAKEDRDFQNAIKAAMQGASANEAAASRGLSLTKQSGSRNLGVIVRPIRGSKDNAAAANSAVAVYIRDPETNPEVEGELVRQLFDLTPAEAAVARRLTAGLSLEDAATSLDISRNTARAHLRSIFSKSGITRQTELVRLVLNSAVILGHGPRQAA
ncbi:helix-turn-helix transcriptional regulator [Aminobacter sp. AP02]|uniref:helix-turn-helix transcriptional regulator n=1 Tax=Aminobacter sp. AP02 TaxID=2135737 RepID=UPI000D6BF03E|nr:helix-turn-helix transcriptional regulator [Aminobacter sp. AP02]PWK73944.1 DNA-binding CsgD family transcriptional regulator [Aminobacter sp. AP02]